MRNLKQPQNPPLKLGKRDPHPHSLEEGRIYKELQPRDFRATRLILGDELQTPLMPFASYELLIPLKDPRIAALGPIDRRDITDIVRNLVIGIHGIRFSSFPHSGLDLGLIPWLGTGRHPCRRC